MALSSSKMLMARSDSELAGLIGDKFPHSGADARSALVAAADIRRFDRGALILRQGDESYSALVVDGHVAGRRTTAEGRQLTTQILTRGALVGVLPLRARPVSGDVIALTPTVAAIWRSEDIRALATTDAGLATDILDEVLRTFEAVVGRLEDLLHQGAVRRVSRVLSLHADLFFGEQPVLTRASLPALVGTSREMTGRVLRTLEAHRIVGRGHGGRILLLDAAGLAAAAEADFDPSGLPPSALDARRKAAGSVASEELPVLPASAAA
jgi:CRP-like cAMP-binding protein